MIFTKILTYFASNNNEQHNIEEDTIEQGTYLNVIKFDSKAGTWQIIRNTAATIPMLQEYDYSMGVCNNIYATFESENELNSKLQTLIYNFRTRNNIFV